MGLGKSKEPIDQQTIDNTGEVNNNVFVSNPVNIQSDEMVKLMSIICGIKIIELAYVFFKMYQRYMKKKYQQQQ